MRSQPQEHQQKSIGNELRALRLAKGLSGARLAARCSMSQSKVSRLETGKIRPTVLEVERILAALEVPDEVASELLSAVRLANIEYTSWRKYAQNGLWRRQIEHRKLAEQARIVREFLPAMPSGLLQIADYAAHAMSPIIPESPGVRGPISVQARMARQVVLDDEGCTFVFLLTEQAVRWRYAPAEVMANQLRHMARQTQRPNVEIAIIPQSAVVNSGPLATFFLFADQMVVIELFTGEVTLRDPKDVSYYRSLFDFFYSHAITGSTARDFLLEIAEQFAREVQ